MPELDPLRLAGVEENGRVEIKGALKGYQRISPGGTDFCTVLLATSCSVMLLVLSDW